MSAGVVKRLDRAVGCASDDQSLFTDLGDEVFAGSHDVFGTTNRDPIAVPDVRQFTTIVIGIVVPRRRQTGFRAVQ